MIFHGYSPSTVAPVLIIILIFIAILYLLRIRRRVVEVSSIGLWRDLLERSRYRRWHDWLKRFLSFLLAAIVVGLIALALIDPRQEEDTSASYHTVYLVDASGSMEALARGTEQEAYACTTRFSCAQKVLSERIEAMHANERAIVLEVSGMIQAVSGPFQSDKTSLLKAVSQLKCHASSVAWEEALTQAKHLLREKKNPKITLITDGQFDESIKNKNIIPDDIAVEQITFGEKTGNLSIDAFNARRYISNRLGFEVFVKVTNTFDVPVTADLTLYKLGRLESVLADGGDSEDEENIIATKRLTLASGGTEIRLYDNLPLESGRLASRIEIVSPTDIRDPMALDDVSYAVIPDYAAPRILLITPGNLYLEAALLLNENYRVALSKPWDGAILQSDGAIDIARLAREYDIVIVDNSYGNIGRLSQDDWSGRVIWIAPEDSYSPYRQEWVTNPVIERVNSKHGIGRWLSLKNLNIAKSHVFRGVSASQTVIRAIEGPIVVSRTSETRREVAIGFRLVQSDIIFRVALPILFINAIDWLMDEESVPERAYATGTPWHVAVGGGISRVDVESPDGQIVKDIPVFDNKVAFYGEKTGIYRLTSQEQPSFAKDIAANFSQAMESNLNREVLDLTNEAAAELPDKGVEDDAESMGILALILDKLPTTSQYIWVLALLFAFILLTLEWGLFHRRYTV